MECDFCDFALKNNLGGRDWKEDLGKRPLPPKDYIGSKGI